MRLSEITPFVRQAIISKMTVGGYIFHKLKTRDHRLFYILGGGGSIVIEGASYRIEPGMLVLFRSGTEYIWQVEDMRYIAINFDYTEAHSDLKRSLHVERSENVDSVLEPELLIEGAEALEAPIVLYGMQSVEGMLMNIVGEFSVDTRYRGEYISAALRLVIMSVLREYSKEGECRYASSVVRDIIVYIRENYSRPLRNTEIAEVFHFNPSYMNRLFKAHTGISVRAFIIDCRISASAELLTSSDMSVLDIALSVGFTELAHFTKTFKAHIGLSPSEYRRSSHARIAERRQ